MSKNKALVFDMDGTIANLYGVDNWLEDLRAENVRPYEIAKPMYDMVELNTILEMLKGFGYKVIVTSWLANGSSDNYKAEVARVKREWLARYEFPFDEAYMVDYGTPKEEVTRAEKFIEQILFDDNEDVRNGWDLGRTIDANKSIIDFLIDLVAREIMNYT